jgi:toxin ParE1/3/4
MAFNVTIKPIVFFDLQDATDWYESKAKGLGKRFQVSVDAAIAKITINPHCHGFYYLEIRMALVTKFPYKIYYIINKNNVAIIGISHTKRDNAFIENRLKLV